MSIRHDGCDHGHDPGRRRFLGTALVGSVAATVLRLVSMGRAAAALAPGDHTLVVVFLRGGPDGCSLLVPTGDPEYHDLRSSIAVPESRLVPVDADFGLHPAFAPLRAQWDAGRLAAVPACGSLAPTRSHFEQQAEIESGGGDDGWLGRVARLLAATDTGIFTTTAVGGGLPRSLAGSPEVVAVADLDRSTTPPFPGLDDARVERALEALHADDHPLVAGAARTALDALPILRDVAAGLDDDPAADQGEGQYAGPRSPVTAFTDLAAMIRADIGVRVATVDVGGWDTHDDMGDADGGRMTQQIEGLAQGLAAFADRLGPSIETTTVLAMGEFGRRVAENGSGGTDHGRGGVLLAMGGGVAGGRHGEWPGLSPDALVAGDVPVATDWRMIAAEVLTGRLGIADIDAVFPGLGPDRLGILA